MESRKWRTHEAQMLAETLRHAEENIHRLDDTLAHWAREAYMLRLQIDALAGALGEATGVARLDSAEDSVARLRRCVQKVQALTGLPNLATIHDIREEEQNV